jgi:hypothetical protein
MSIFIEEGNYEKTIYRDNHCCAGLDATYSSKTILEAIQDALLKAGAKANMIK